MREFIALFLVAAVVPGGLVLIAAVLVRRWLVVRRQRYCRGLADQVRPAAVIGGKPAIMLTPAALMYRCHKCSTLNYKHERRCRRCGTTHSMKRRGWAVV